MPYAYAGSNVSLSFFLLPPPHGAKGVGIHDALPRLAFGGVYPIIIPIRSCAPRPAAQVRDSPRMSGEWRKEERREGGHSIHLLPHLRRGGGGERKGGREGGGRGDGM